MLKGAQFVKIENTEAQIEISIQLNDLPTSITLILFILRVTSFNIITIFTFEKESNETITILRTDHNLDFHFKISHEQKDHTSNHFYYHSVLNIDYR